MSGPPAAGRARRACSASLLVFAIPPARWAADRGRRRGARAGDREPLHRDRPHRPDRRAAHLRGDRGVCSRSARGCALADASPLGWHLLAALAAAAAVLLKGPVASALIGPAAVAWSSIERPACTDRRRGFLLPARRSRAVAAAVVRLGERRDRRRVRSASSSGTTTSRGSPAARRCSRRTRGGTTSRGSRSISSRGRRFSSAAVVWALRSGRWRTDPHLRFGADRRSR